MSDVKWMVVNDSMMKYLNLPNCITSLRIIGAILLFFIVPLSIPFYVVYTLCGLSDALDGLVARATGSSSEFGARLDSVADLTFYAAMLIRLLPELWKLLPRWIWYVVAALILIRLLSYGLAAIRYRRFASLHTYMNKLTGASMFAVPYFLPTVIGEYYCFGVAAVAGLAAVEELLMHVTSKQYTPGRKSIFMSPAAPQNDAAN